VIFLLIFQRKIFVVSLEREVNFLVVKLNSQDVVVTALLNMRMMLLLKKFLMISSRILLFLKITS